MTIFNAWLLTHKSLNCAPEYILKDILKQLERFCNW